MTSDLEVTESKCFNSCGVIALKLGPQEVATKELPRGLASLWYLQANEIQHVKMQERDLREISLTLITYNP